MPTSKPSKPTKKLRIIPKRGPGKPLKFQSVEDLQAQIDAYFESCFELKTVTKGKGKSKITETIKIQAKPYTVTGLANALDTTRDVLLDYEQKDKYSNAIKRAKGKILQFAEESLWNNSVAGVIFNLKNNWGWKDKHEVEHTGEAVAQSLIVVLQVLPEDARRMLIDNIGVLLANNHGQGTGETT